MVPSTHSHLHSTVPIKQPATDWRKLIHGVRLDEVGAFDVLIIAAGKIINLLARHYVPGMDREDLLQEYHLSTYQAAMKWHGRGDFGGYLYRFLSLRYRQLLRWSTRRQARDVLNRLSLERRIQGRDGDDHRSRLASPEPGPLTQTIRREEVEHAAGKLFDASSPTARAAAPLLLLGMDHVEATRFLDSRGYETKAGKLGEQSTRKAMHRTTSSLGGHAGRRKQIVAIDSQGQQVGRWSSLAAAAEAVGLSQGTISQAAREDGRTAGGWKWKYVEAMVNVSQVRSNNT